MNHVGSNTVVISLFILQNGYTRVQTLLTYNHGYDAVGTGMHGC